ncbi:MAG: type VI secretion system-associated protein TagF [Deltaproteobacteria bacterium]|nr:type VI secretion system-associated protein TagF [Deltaproteobacteria bacterium]
MLGAVKGSGEWLWAAVGKHPVARDYIRLGRSSPMMDGFSAWVDGGYRDLHSREPKGNPALRSFRFWALGAGPGLLACGVVRDSHDAVGRPFPLLIMGSGSLRDWEERWDLLPLACEGAWEQIESLAGRRFAELRPLEEAVGRIRPPQPLWNGYAETGSALREGRSGTGDEAAGRFRGIERKAEAAAREAAGIVSLDEPPGTDVFLAIQAWHAGLKRGAKEPPKALFMGGNAERACLAFFRRPLSAGDFPRIWGHAVEAA